MKARMIQEEIERGLREHGPFKDEENAASVLEHEVQDLFYYVRRKKLDGQGSAVNEWIQIIAVASRALEQYYPQLS